ncbi:unnamed protein product [Albugo candida]|nr:unnamed protein product [Albugo candida]|eukprot:CCI44694.1 unnamed protein product [Albugo candida]
MEACGQQVFALEEALLCSKQTISTLQQKNISLQIELCQAQINASHCHKEHQRLFAAHETEQRTAKLMEKQLHTLRENVSLFTTRIDTLCAEKNDHIFLVAALEQKLEKCHFAAVQFDEKLREMNKSLIQNKNISKQMKNQLRCKEKEIALWKRRYPLSVPTPHTEHREAQTDTFTQQNRNIRKFKDTFHAIGIFAQSFDSFQREIRTQLFSFSEFVNEFASTLKVTANRAVSKVKDEMQRRKEQSDLSLEDLRIKWTHQLAYCNQTHNKRANALHTALHKQQNKFSCLQTFQNWRIFRYKVFIGQITHENMLVFALNQRERMNSSLKQDEMWKRWRSINPGMRQKAQHSSAGSSPNNILERPFL